MATFLDHFNVFFLVSRQETSFLMVSSLSLFFSSDVDLVQRILMLTEADFGGAGGNRGQLQPGGAGCSGVSRAAALQGPGRRRGWPWVLQELVMRQIELDTH